jgi:hypothetical protein
VAGSAYVVLTLRPQADALGSRLPKPGALNGRQSSLVKASPPTSSPAP